MNERFKVGKSHDQTALYKDRSGHCEDRLESSPLAVGEMMVFLQAKLSICHY